MMRTGSVTSMKAWTLAALLLAACGGSGGGTHDDGGAKALDGFVSTTCASDTDCSADACNVAKCNGANHMCTTSPKDCTTANSCTITTSPCATIVCDASSGSAVWNAMPMGDGQACTTDTGGAAGTCSAGVCNPIPSCLNVNFEQSVSCDSSENSFEDSTDPTFGDATANVSSYACAPTEAGAEVSALLGLDPSAMTPQNVTLSLRITDENGTVLADQTGFDLDLIVLEDSCVGTATCMNPSSGGTFQGVTAGTSAETVTFTADPAHSYYVVVDGKDMNQISNFIVTVDACGACATGNTTTLGCDMTMPVTGTTSTGMSQLTSYMCGTTPVALAGKEIPYVFKDPSGAARPVTATLTATDPSKPATVLVLSEGDYSDCEASNCLVSQATDPMSGVGAATFTTDGTSSYYVVVDTVGTVDSQYGLAVSCAPYCTAEEFEYIDCDDDVAEADSMTTGTSQASQWGPSGMACGNLTGLTGPEDVIPFFPAAAGTYALTLTSQTQNLSFTVLDGLAAGTSCSPTYACANFTATTVMANGATSTGTFTTDVTTDPVNPKPATGKLVVAAGHNYYIVVDGKGTGDSFTVVAKGPSAGTGCQ